MPHAGSRRVIVVNSLVVTAMLLFAVLAPWGRSAFAVDGPAADSSEPASAPTDSGSEMNDRDAGSGGDGSGDAGDSGAAGDNGGGDGSDGGGEPTASSGGSGEGADEGAAGSAGSGEESEGGSTSDAGGSDGSGGSPASDSGAEGTSESGSDDGSSSPPGHDGVQAEGSGGDDEPSSQEQSSGQDSQVSTQELQNGPATDDSGGTAGDGGAGSSGSGAGGGASGDGSDASDTEENGTEVGATEEGAGQGEATDAGAEQTSGAGGGEATDESVVTSTVRLDNEDAQGADGASLDDGEAGDAQGPSTEPTQQEVEHVDTTLDAVAEVQDALEAIDVSSDGQAEASDASQTTVDASDSSQLSDAIAEAIQAAEASSTEGTHTEEESSATTDAEAQAVAALVENLLDSSSASTADEPVMQQVFIPNEDESSTETGVVQLLVTDTGTTAGETTTAQVTVVTTEEGTLVQVIDTSKFNPASPDPSGITFIPGSDRLLISDAEVEEMAIYQGVNLYEATRTGSLTATGDTTTFSREPTGLGFNPADGTLFVADDQADRIFLVRPGIDGRHGTADDEQVGSIDVDSFELPVDAEGVEYDVNSGHVFIADGNGREVWRVDPGVNGTFGDADDVVSHFDVEQFGILDPEGIGSVAARDNLIIVDNPSNSVYEITKSGELVRIVSLSALSAVPGTKRLAGVTLAPGSQDPNALNLWITARGVDNNADPNENDGKVFEISWPSAPLLVEPPPPPPSSTLVIPVATGRDDAEEKPGGRVVTGHAGLELVDISAGPQTVGLRFVGVTLASGATVVNAYVQFTARRTPRTATNLTIQGEASDNADTFATTAFNISSRDRTAASVQWSPPRWAPVGSAGPNERTPDLSAILQEIIDRPGWQSGNALALVITGSGKRVAEAFEGAAAPVLHIEYTEAGTAMVTTSSGEPVGQVSEDGVLRLDAEALDSASSSSDASSSSTSTSSSSTKDTCDECARRAANATDGPRDRVRDRRYAADGRACRHRARAEARRWARRSEGNNSRRRYRERRARLQQACRR